MEHSATQREYQKIWTAIKNWFLVDKVFLISFIIAIIAISLGGVTTRFFNYHVIVTVSGLMLVIGGFKEWLSPEFFLAAVDIIIGFLEMR